MVKLGKVSRVPGMVKKDHVIAKTPKDVNQDKRLSNIEKQIHKINSDSELKYLDTITDSPATLTGQLTFLCGLVQGLRQNERIGGQVQATSLQWRLGFRSLTALTAPVGYRHIIFMDRQNNGLAPGVADNPISGAPAVLNTAVITNLLHAPFTYEQHKRFKILHDQRGVLNLQGLATTTTIPYLHFIKGFKKLNHQLKWDGTSAANASMVTNAIYGLVITDTATVPLVEGGYRLYFKDS